MHEFKQLDPATQAALLYSVIFNVTDRHTLYKIAKGPQAYEKLTDNSKIVTANRYFKTPKMLAAVADLNYILEDKLNKANEEYYNSRRETETTQTTKQATQNDNINFLNLDEFLSFANEQANKIKDEKERRNWVELIGKYMRFKENEEETEQIRAYLPQTCENCELKKRCEVCPFEVCKVQTL